MTVGFGGWGVGPHAAANDTPGEPGSGRFAYRLETPGVRTTAHRAAGYSRIEIEGFRTSERRIGAPDIPVKTIRVAIPPGAVPRLEIRSGAVRRLPGVVPAPVPRTFLSLSPQDRAAFRPDAGERGRGREMLQRGSRKHFEADTAIYEGHEPHPRRVAWLGQVGVLRDQRYVEVHLAPVRYLPRKRALETREAIEIVVHFDQALETADEPALEPAFERVYRRAFENYEQGKTFRMSAAVPEASAPASAESISTRESVGPRHRLRVRENGPLRLDYALLQPAGFDAHPISDWKLSCHGQQVPLLIHDADSDGMLDPTDWVQFYGQALDTEGLPELNTDFPGSFPDIFEARDFSDENVYFLTVETTAQPAMTENAGAPAMTTSPAHFEGVAHAEVEDGFRPLGGADPWYWLPTLAGTGGNSPTSRSDVIPLPGLFPGNEPVRVLVNVRGSSEDGGLDPDHQTVVRLKDDLGAVLDTDSASFDGRVLYLHDFTFPNSGGAVTDPVEVELEALDVGGGVRNDVILDYIQVRYRQSFSAIGGDALVFEWPDGDADFVIDNLTDAAPEVWEITLPSGETVVPTGRITGAQVTGIAPPYALRFHMANDPGLADGTPRRFIVFGSGAITVPSSVDFPVDTVSDLRDNLTRADMIVIAHPDVLDTTAGQPFDLWLTHRSSPAGGDFDIKLAMIEDVQDEFNDGLPGPLAIREFLRFVLSTQQGEGWADPRPTHVVLLGDGSYDYKGGTPQGNLVPTQTMFKDVLELGHYASDSVMGAVVGVDQLTDFYIGRIPARSVAEANLVLQKILDYEQSPPAGAWQTHALFISDEGIAGNDPPEALEFEATNDEAEARMDIPPYTSAKLRYYSDYIVPGVNNPASTMRDDIVDAVNGADGNDGAAMLQYVGHGNYVVWSNAPFFDERQPPPPPPPPPRDTESLTNGGKLPWVLAHNCLTGGFHIPLQYTMGEDWINLPGGGAIAVFSPSGLSFNFIGREVTELMWEEVFGDPKEREIGPPTLIAMADLCGVGSIEPCQNYVLLGDPATRLVLPSVDPPSNLQATAGNMEVDLTWTASGDAGVEYDVYRTNSLNPPAYIKLNGSPVAGTSFNDPNRTNTLTYYYYVVGTDPSGFVSPWSNYNTDCALPTPQDCVSATPLNPDPPAVPQNPVITDPGTGSQLLLSWDPVGESDLTHYGPEWGTQPGNRPNSTTVTANSFLLSDLTENQEYCFAVTATNSSGNTSNPSVEVCDFPVFSPGLRPPDFIEDLEVSVQGPDILLEWGEVTTDVHGKAKTVTAYEVYRGDGSDYSVLNLITCPASCLSSVCSCTDAGAGSSSTDHHYRVRGVDAAGTPGGLGSEMPKFITDLTLQRIGGPHDLLLSWSPVTETFDGGPARIVQYEVYAADHPLTRAEIASGAHDPPVATVGGTSAAFTAPPQSRYYSVLAVDRYGNKSPH